MYKDLKEYYWWNNMHEEENYSFCIQVFDLSTSERRTLETSKMVTTIGDS